MKKITLVLVALAFVAGVAGAQGVTLAYGGSATVEWGFAGQLIDNTGSFLDASVPSGDFYTATTGGLGTGAAPDLTLRLSVSDEDGNVFVEAAATADAALPWQFSWAMSVSFDYIRFPNVVPGILGITLDNAGTLVPGNNTPFGSTTTNERIWVKVTPIEQLAATVGLILKPDNKLYTTYYADTTVAAPAASGTGTFTYPDRGDFGDLDDFDDYDAGVALAKYPWEAGTYFTFAASLEATFTQKIGDSDSIAAGIGTVYDVAYFNGTYEPDYLVDGTDFTYSRFTDDATVSENSNQAVITQVYGPKTVNALSIEEMMPTLFDPLSTDEAKMLRTNQVLGRRTIPLGVNVDASIAGITAGVDFKTALTEGNASNSYTGVYDLTDTTKSTLNYAPYAMPMYAAVNLGYSLAAGDMTITPSAGFKYSSDYWKWGSDAADADADGKYWEYSGDVGAADYIGRPMSAKAGVDVKGIAGMIDVSVSGNLGFGDTPANHGFGILNGTTPAGLAVFAGLLSAAGIPLPAYTFTHDADTGAIETVVFENTIADMIDFWKIQSTLAADDSIYWNYGTEKPADKTNDGMNNGFFAKGSTAIGASLGITAMPIDGLTLKNTTAYSVDNLGIGTAGDSTTLWGAKLNSLSNTTDITYAWMVGEAVAFTLFGQLTYASTGYETEKGQKYVGLRADDDPALITDVFEFGYSEAPSKATFSYKAGIRCSVGLE